MNLEKGIEIISDNYYGKENSLVSSLYNDCDFSEEKFWQLYDSIVCLINSNFYAEDMLFRIGIVYQRILKEMIYHFSPYDVSVIKNFPENYNGYIERLDFAYNAYYARNPELLADDTFELQRENRIK